MKNKGVHPPKWAMRLLEWYCKPELLEDLQGDLYEYFDRNLEAKGKRRARFNYVLDVIKFFKPYTVRKLEILGQLTQFIMFKNYFKTSIRSIVRNKLFLANHSTAAKIYLYATGHCWTDSLSRCLPDISGSLTRLLNSYVTQVLSLRWSLLTLLGSYFSTRFKSNLEDDRSKPSRFPTK